jgi:hypothetical protein
MSLSIGGSVVGCRSLFLSGFYKSLQHATALVEAQEVTLRPAFVNGVDGAAQRRPSAGDGVHGGGVCRF